MFVLLPIDAMRIQWKFGTRNSNVHFYTFDAIENLAEISGQFWLCPMHSKMHFYTFDAIENLGEIWPIWAMS